MKVKLIAHTPEPDKVVSMAAKLCYSKVGVEDIEEDLTDEKVEKFLNHLVSIGHESPVEHVTFTFAIEGISRACSHQIVRHRLASYSQQSQRYVKLDQFEYIIPPAIENDKYAKRIFIEHMEKSQEAYDRLVNSLMLEKIKNNEQYLFDITTMICADPEYADPNGKICIKNIEEVFCMINNAKDNRHPSLLDKYKNKYPKEYNKIEKQAIEDARYVFPNACETKIVVTMNARSLLHFFNVRCCNRAQWEIRQMADEMLRQCKEVAPILFKNAGPNCTYGKCSEGNMCCGNPRRPEEFEK